MMLAARDLRSRIARDGPLILDGGLATELERRGYNIDDPLWSARVLLDHPQAIRQLHLDYLAAGADVLITATYQASLPGLKAAGLDHDAAVNILQRAVDLAVDARRQWQNDSRRPTDRASALIAASVGPYGAYRHDGSEYTGDYRISRAELLDFHRERLRILAHSGADLLACETIPSLAEAEVLLELLADVPDIAAWFSFSCRNDKHICHGEPISSCARLLDTAAHVVAVGVNCTAPQWIPGLIRELRAHTARPIVVYPNSGETWDAGARCWTGTASADEFAAAAAQWATEGAMLIGGCCRTGPEHIRRLAETVRGRDAHD